MADKTREVLINPFKPGEKVIIPAGAVYTSTDPTIKGRQQTKVAQTVIVEDAFPATLVRTRANRLLVRPLRIRTKNSNEYARDINITAQIIQLNGITPNYEQVSADA